MVTAQKTDFLGYKCCKTCQEPLWLGILEAIVPPSSSPISEKHLVLDSLDSFSRAQMQFGQESHTNLLGPCGYGPSAVETLVPQLPCKQCWPYKWAQTTISCQPVISLTQSLNKLPFCTTVFRLLQPVQSVTVPVWGFWVAVQRSNSSLLWVASGF